MHSGRLVDKAREYPTSEKFALASADLSKARILTTEMALQVVNALFQLCGTGSIRTECGFDRYWRIARTYTAHDPANWRYHLKLGRA
ncbi:acyl-CoA dehydrogenase family protein [Mesorhizobium sp. 2RAF21]|uniref:acyl-CoA dehydrogenase family protein n=1 Tax=Mesorhizobium sp. 2RAF21 TaxID=3232995 RepID=UPI003F957FC5